MKQFCEIALLVTVCLILAPFLSAEKDTATEKTIAALEQQWAEAQRDGKSAAVAPLLAASFVNTDTSGQIEAKISFCPTSRAGSGNTTRSVT